MDEVDRLFHLDWANSFFAAIRAIFNRRASAPNEPWHRLTFVIAHSTEPHLFITEVGMSPFNIGERVELADFTPNQAAELNRRYGSPLRDSVETDALFELVNGHPYLTGRMLYEVSAKRGRFADLLARADQEDGPFGEHLRQLPRLQHDPTLVDPTLVKTLCSILQGGATPPEDHFYRLRSAGFIAGDTPNRAQARNPLYARYLQRTLCAY